MKGRIKLYPVFWGQFLLLLLMCACPHLVHASETGATVALPESLVLEQSSKLNLEDLEAFLNKIDQDLHSQLSKTSLSEIINSIRQGKLDIDLLELFKLLLNFFFRQVMTHSVLLGKLLILGVILALLEHLQGAFEKNTVAKLAHGIGVLALLTLALSSFTLAINTGRDAITNMVGFMQSLLPVILTLMAALGNLTTVALMHPVILFSLNVLGMLTRNIVFPLIFCAAVLGIVNQLSDRFQISRLVALFRDGSVLILSFFLMIFIGILGIQGVAGAVSDGIGLRTAKFITGAFVPVVGGVLTDAVEVVAGCSLFLKNAVGILGAVALLFLCALPIVKILSAAVVYRLAAALMQPLGANQLGESLHILSNCLFLVFAAVAAVGLMFFIALTIIVGLGNMTVMLR